MGPDDEGGWGKINTAVAGFAPAAGVVDPAGRRIGVGIQVTSVDVNPRAAVLHDDPPVSAGVVVPVIPVVVGEEGKAHRQ